MNYMTQQLNICIANCSPSDTLCNQVCANVYAGSIQDCPCNDGCKSGCPCSNYDCADGIDQQLPIDPNPQRFPEPNFIKFDEIWEGTMSYNSFRNSFSKVDPSSYICTDDQGQIWRKKLSSYQSDKLSDCSTDGVRIASSTFVEWYKAGGYQSYTMSADEKFMLTYKNYQKQWRHSFFADYSVYDLVNDMAIESADVSNYPQAQYAGWSPVDHSLVWVSNDKDIYYQKGQFGVSSTVRVTNTGGWCIDNPRILSTVYEGKSKGIV